MTGELRMALPYKSVGLFLSTLLTWSSLFHWVNVRAVTPNVARQPNLTFPIAQQQNASQLLSQGIQQFETRQFQSALQSFQQALSQQQQGNRTQAGATLNYLSKTYHELRDYDLALESGQQSLALTRELKDRALEGTVLVTTATAYNSLGFYVKAIEAAQSSLKIAQELKDPKTEVLASISLSDAHQSLREQAKALEYAQQSLTVAQKSRDRKLEVKALSKLGNFYHYLQQDYPKALEIYQQALAIAKSGQDANGQLLVLPSIYNVYYRTKQYDQSIAHVQQAIQLAQQIGDRRFEAWALEDLGDVYTAMSQPDRALEFYQQSLTVARSAQDPQLVAIVLTNLGNFYRERRDFAKTFDYYQQSLSMYRQLNRQADVMKTLRTIGNIHNSLNDYPKAIDAYQQAVAIAQTLKKRDWEGGTLTAIGNTYYRQRNYQQAILFYQQALPIFRELQSNRDQSTLLTNIGDAYGELKDYRQKVDYYQQAIAVDRAMKNAEYEVTDLINLASVYAENLNERQSAIKYYQQALQLAQNSGERNFERTTLMSLGNAYSFKLGDTPQGIQYHQQALAIARAQKRPELASTLVELAGAYALRGNFQQAVAWGQEGLTLAQQMKDLKVQGGALSILGTVYNQHGEFQQAIQYFQQALTLARSTQNRPLEEVVLVNLGGAYALGENRHQQGLELVQQGLTLTRELRDREQEALALTILSLIYQQLNDYTQAIDLAQQSLTISRETGSYQTELFTRFSLWMTYIALGDYTQATSYGQQVLELSRKTNQRLMEGLALLQLGSDAQRQKDTDRAIDLAQQATAISEESPFLKSVAIGLLASAYTSKGNYGKAIELGQQNLAMSRKLKNAAFISADLSDLGYYYRKAGQFKQAIASYQEALATNPTPEIPGSNSGTYAGLARTYRRLNQPTIAIVHYKKAVDRVEEFRRKIQGLPPELQASFLQAGAEGDKPVDIYRELADLLLSQQRVAEAQNVLELLKAEEIEDFRRGGEGIATDSTPTEQSTFTATEAEILKQNGTLIAFGRRVAECKASQCAQLSQLNDQLQGLTDQYFKNIEGLEQAYFARKDTALLNPRSLKSMREIVEAQPGTVMIYPFVLDDKIWLIWAAQGGVVKSIEVPVKKEQLWETVQQFRQAITNSKSSPNKYQPIGKQLYDWLVKPLETELQNNKIQNLVFSLDGSTRYIPMAALFDGKKHLIETYTVSVVLSADKTDMRDRLPTETQNISVLALGASEFQNFNPLPNVPQEVNAIVRPSLPDKNGIFPGLKFLNRNFDLPALRDNLTKSKILHIATHAAFVNGKPEDSYLVLGTGEKFTIRKIQTVPDLDKVHLVVLSACQTAVGGQDRDGVEIAGISSYFMEGGAKSVIASLWSVSDASTSQLMQTFYQHLARNTSKPMTKAQALRQAQLSLLHGKGEFSHPYYWAPFILIGNSL